MHYMKEVQEWDHIRKEVQWPDAHGGLGTYTDTDRGRSGP